MTGNKNGFIKLHKSVKKVLKFAHRMHVTSGGKGNIFVVRKDDRKASNTNVLHVPSMTCNLISISQLLTKGYNMKLEKNKKKVYDGDRKMILKATLADNKTFKVEINTVDHKCLAFTAEEDKN
ncbi:uncharacterized protein LOC131598600 [Vicia villosa]|uniref:uncharacterized protein LOC131598600 n=1 Tax=Vicia villosa TaxID=3911 RepID=UPI00273B55C7|nr:uncharacterized protein LOC131598600 [Vicia villosa]